MINAEKLKQFRICYQKDFQTQHNFGKDQPVGFVENQRWGVFPRWKKNSSEFSVREILVNILSSNFLQKGIEK
jgi:hypothetical protein